VVAALAGSFGSFFNHRSMERGQESSPGAAKVTPRL
jgi:hypothetical protein